MPEPVVVAELEKNKRELVRVSLEEFNGHQLLNVRAWARDPDKGMIPTRSGIALRVAMLPNLVAALQAAEREARSRGLL